jgi:predicted nucleic acid-binding Zn ribbon protein
MPAYDYHCEANDKTIEVRHSITATLTTWSDLCEAAGIDLGNTSADAAVKRAIGGGILNVAKRTGGPAQAPAPAGGHQCGGGCRH